MDVTFVVNRHDNSFVDIVPIHESTSALQDYSHMDSDFDVGHRSMDVREPVER